MITSILSFIIAFGILVLVHEFGHFWVARKTGVTVEKFSIGFGPRLFGFRSKGTEFCVSLIPLGGFVKMKGDEDESQIRPDDKAAFANKSVGARSAIVMAGPFMNFLLAFALMPLVFWIGKPEPAFLKEAPVVERILPGSPAEISELRIGDRLLSFDGKPVPTWENVLESVALTPAEREVRLGVERSGIQKEIAVATAPLPGGQGSYIGIEKYFGEAPEAVVLEVIPQSPAAAAGLQGGDRITAVQGSPVDSWDTLIREVNARKGEALNVEILREGSKQNVAIHPKWDAESRRWLLGIKGPESGGFGVLQTRRHSFTEAVQAGFATNIKMIGLTFQVLKKLFTLELSYKSLGGPVQIAYTLSKAATSGLADFLYFTAFLSLQLAILNILPIPMLDGGHLLFFGIEAIRRRPLSLKVRMIAQQAGLVLLLTLILLVTLNDLDRLTGLSRFFEKIFQ